MILAAMVNEVEILVGASDSSDSSSICAMVMWLLNNNDINVLSLGEKFVLSHPYHISPIALLLLRKYTPIMLRYAAIEMDHLDY